MASSASDGTVPSPNIWHNTDLYELENRCADPDRNIESAIREIYDWSGRDVLDLGCGTGHAVNLMAREFPASTFEGLDIADAAIADADAERVAMDLPNAAFAVADAARLAPDRPYDVITAFDAIHDQAAPEEVLRRVRLAPGGVFVMVDAKFATRLEDNLDNPYAPLTYGISLLFCVPTSIATGGTGLGALWGQELAHEMLAAAGFADVRVLDSPRPQNCIYA
ncbi:MAG: class I SAM-dependent methyltransferase, partial [Actinomycetes bacterium]